MLLISRYKIKVNAGTTHRCGSFILFCVRFCPASERLEVLKTGNVVVMSVPQWQMNKFGASIGSSHNLVPHVIASIDSNSLA